MKTHLSPETAYSVPAKSFVLGEYAVLSGSPALVATFGPRFTMNVSTESGSSFAAASPAGRLLTRAREQRAFEFADPFGGEGGFGASTAQFALAYGVMAREEGWDLSTMGARRTYRELMKDEPLPPSGADLVAQWSGGVVCFDPRTESVEQRFSDLDWRDLLVFSAAAQPGRKVPTHVHLAQLAQGGLRESVQGGGELPSDLTRSLSVILSRALELRDAASLGRAMKDYAQVLAQAGLEIEAARMDREALCGLKGVLGAKGTGARLADGLLVLLEPGTPRRASVISAAQARGLRLVADGLGSRAEAGFAEPGRAS